MGNLRGKRLSTGELLRKHLEGRGLIKHLATLEWFCVCEHVWFNELN